jgi:hypothetical protein
LHAAKSSPRALQKHFPGAGKFHRAGGPEKEGISENLFKLADLLRERRLGKMKTKRGASEVQLLCDRDEVA